MVIKSFTSQDTVYQTTSDTCTCKAKEFNPSVPCKHQRLARKIEAGRPTTVSEARAARIERNARKLVATYRVDGQVYEAVKTETGKIVSEPVLNSEAEETAASYYRMSFMPY